MQNKIQIKRKEVNIVLKDTVTFLYLDTKTREINKSHGTTIKACITKLDSVNAERLTEQDFHGIATRMDNSLNQAIQIVFRGNQAVPKNLKSNQSLVQNFEQKYNVAEWKGDFYRIISNEMMYKGTFSMVFGALLVDSVDIINNMLTDNSSDQEPNSAIVNNINIISNSNDVSNDIGNNANDSANNDEEL